MRSQRKGWVLIWTSQLCLLSAWMVPAFAEAPVVINEVVCQPVDGMADWLELFAPGPDAVSLEGWTLKDASGGQPSPDHLFTFPPGTQVQPGGYLVLDKDAPGSFDFGLGSGDGLFLYDPSGVLVDSTLWQEGQAPEGSSWGRLPNGSGSFEQLYQPTRGLPNVKGPTPGADPSDYIYNGDRRTYTLDVDPEDWEWLDSNETLEVYVPGRLTFENQTFGPVGVRYKGSTGSLYGCFDDQGNQLCDKLSMKIGFDTYQEDGRFYGLKKLQFHAMENDPSKLHERMGYALYREYEVPAPRTSYARLVINGSLIGAYILVEQIDGRFTRYHFAEEGGEGNLYKEVWPVYDDPQVYLDALETNEEEDPDVSPMLAFSQAIADTKPAAAYEMLAKYQDIPHMMRYLAVDRSIENQDGIMAWYCFGPWCSNHNYYWYQEVESGKLWLIPWDLDHAFSPESWFEVLIPGFPEWYEDPGNCRPQRLFGIVGALPPSCDPLINDWGTATWDLYVDAMQVFLETLYSEEALETRINAYVEEVRPLVEEDPFLDMAEWEEAVAQYRLDVITLRETMIEQTGL